MNLLSRVLNKTLFGICDIEKDQAGHLKKYEVSGEGIKFITQINQYDLSMPRHTSMEEYFFNMYPIFFKKLTSPPVKTSTRAELSQHPNKYIAAVTVYSEKQMEKTQMIY